MSLFFFLTLKLLNAIQRNDFTSASVSKVSVLGVLSRALKAHRVNKRPKAELWQALSSLPSRAYGPAHFMLALMLGLPAQVQSSHQGHFLLLILDLPS